MVFECLLCDIAAKIFITNEYRQADLKKTDEKCLLKAVAFNSLLVFLLANVMTGLINMTVHTLHIESGIAFAILLVYMITLCSISSILHAKNISTKFW